MSDKINILKSLALQVRNASVVGENTAERIGRILVGILDLITQNEGGSGSAALEEDIISNATKTGYIETAQRLKKGMTFTSFVQTLLYKPVVATLEGRLTTGNDVEYGSTKGQINYTATRHGNGEMLKAFYENDEKNLLEFSTEVNGVQTAIRALSGIYTKGETYKATVVYAASEDGSVSEMTLNNSITVNVFRKWFAGVVSSIPTTSDEVRALKYSGLYKGAGNYTFDATDWKMVAICFPAGAKLSKLSFKGYIADLIPGDGTLKLADSVMVKGANDTTAEKYNVWYVKSAIVNNVTNNGTITIS